MENLFDNKRGKLLYEVIMHLILVGLIFAMFLFATAGRIDSKSVKQEILEKQIALVIDAAEPGMSFFIEKENLHGVINSLEIRDNRVFVRVADFKSLKGFPLFSIYDVSVEELEDKYIVRVE